MIIVIMSTPFQWNKISSELKDKFIILRENRIFVDDDYGFFELSCCANDAYLVNVGYKKDDEFKEEWDAFVCGYLDCLNKETMKFHLHIALLNAKDYIKDKIKRILNGEYIHNCKCYQRGDKEIHTLSFTLEINVSADDIKFLEDFYIYVQN